MTCAFGYFSSLFSRGGWVGSAVCGFFANCRALFGFIFNGRTIQHPFTKNIGLTPALHFRALFGVHFLTAGQDSAHLQKNIGLTPVLHFPCAFLGMAPFAVGRLAVDTYTCSSSLLQAHSTIPGFVLRHKKMQLRRRASCLYSSHYYKGRLGGVSSQKIV